MNYEDEDQDQGEAVLSSTGWYVVECIERMIDKDFTLEEICTALDIPSTFHLAHMLEWAKREREELVNELSSPE